MPLHEGQQESKTGQELPKAPEQLDYLKQQAEEELLDLQSLISQTRANVPQDDIFTLDLLNEQDAEAKLALNDFLTSFQTTPQAPPNEPEEAGLDAIFASLRQPRQEDSTTSPLLDQEAFGLALETNQEQALSQAKQALNKLFSGNALLEDLETVFEHTAHIEIKNLISREMSPRLGADMVAKLLNDANYRKQLKELQNELSEPFTENGPLPLKDRSLDKLIAIKEIFGESSKEIAAAFDLSRQDERLKVNPNKNLFDVFYGIEKDGQPFMDVNVELNFEDSGRNSVGNIKRGFALKNVQTPNGIEQKKHVRHENLKLGVAYQGDGLAARMLSEALTAYDKISVKEIKTKANIDMGGYVWQSYGFGWDIEAAAHGVNPKENPKLAEQNLQIYIERKIGNAKENAVVRLTEMGLIDGQGRAKQAELQTALESYDKLAEQPLAVTPQDLAHVGIEIEHLRFYRQVTELNLFSSDETWMTAEELELRTNSGEINAEKAAIIKKNAFHLGKLGMASTDFEWDGKIDLDPNSPSRKQFEDKLKRAGKK